MTPNRRGHMASYIQRRKFLATLLGGAAAASPLRARAQQRERMRRIGLLIVVSDDRAGQARVTALKQGLQEIRMDRRPQHPNRDTLWWGRRRPHTGSRSRTGGARARRTRRPGDARY